MNYDLLVYYKNLNWAERKNVRNQYIKEQNRKCYYCGFCLDEPAPKHIKEKSINWKLFPENFLKYPIHLHHNHKTGLTEGAVHNYCNAVMCQYEGI